MCLESFCFIMSAETNQFAQLQQGSEVKMLFQSEYMLTRLQEQRSREFIRQAEKDRLCAEARPRKKGQAAQIARKIVHSVGHVLLGAGAQLENLATRDASLAQE